MKLLRTKLHTLGCAAAYLTSAILGPAASAGTWSPVLNAPLDAIGTMLLLPDGTVMAADASTSNGWYRLTPDIHGSYANGTWSTLAPMNYSRLYYSSQVLQDGRVFVAGAEYGTGGSTAEVYDPVANTWTITPAAGMKFYDSISEILPNGNVLVAPVFPSTTGETLIYSPVTNTWSVGPTLYQGNGTVKYQDEASWVKLTDGSILTVDPFSVTSERYIPSLNQWVGDTTVPVSLYSSMGEEGPAFLLPNGQAIFFGATGHNAIYTPTGTTNPGTWTAAPDFPSQQGMSDAPGAMMVNGKILCITSPAGSYNPPAVFYEFDPGTTNFTQVSGPDGTGSTTITYECRMLDLPDGTVLFTTGNSLYIYQPGGTPLAAAQPAVSSITQNPDGSYHLTGTQLNGISEGAAYGDDAQMNSNYPLVRMTNNATGNVYYARTYNWSSTGVMTGTNLVTTEFAALPAVPAGTYSLVVVANGIASTAIPLTIISPPIIQSQPAPVISFAGGSATFSIAASGTTPLFYQWSRNSLPIAGATNTSYTTNNLQNSDTGSYYSCLISNIYGTTNSLAATLSVALLPQITWTNPAPINFGTALSSNQLDATAKVPGSFVYNSRIGTILRAGTYTLSVVFTPTDTNDYLTASNNVSLVVQPAPLTATGSNASRPYGTTNPVFTGVVIGAVNGDNITASYFCTATTNSPAGNYTILQNIVDHNESLINYAITTNNGTLTVTPVIPHLTWTNPAAITYGTPLGSNQLHATATVPGSFAYNPTNGIVLNVGTNTLSVIFTPTDTNDYTTVTNSVSLVVLPVPSPVIQAVGQAGGSISFTWSSTPGQIYQVQYATNLGQTNWTSFGSAFTASNSTLTASDAMTNSPRFYRILLLQ